MLESGLLFLYKVSVLEGLSLNGYLNVIRIVSFMYRDGSLLIPTVHVDVVYVLRNDGAQDLLGSFSYSLNGPGSLTRTPEGTLPYFRFAVWMYSAHSSTSMIWDLGTWKRPVV